MEVSTICDFHGVSLNHTTESCDSMVSTRPPARSIEEDIKIQTKLSNHFTEVMKQVGMRVIFSKTMRLLFANLRTRHQTDKRLHCSLATVLNQLVNIVTVSVLAQCLHVCCHSYLFTNVPYVNLT